jgi:hypothetical protein
MVSASPGADDAVRRPNRIDLLAGILIACSVVLHVVAMFPTYFAGPGDHGSLASQPDQAALYAVLAAGWALVLVIGLTGPARMPVAAGMAVGLAATELGFRITDLGYVARYGTVEAGAGLWLMTAAWVVGAAGAVVAAVAAVRRSRPEPAGTTAEPSAEARSPVASPYAFPSWSSSSAPASEPGFSAGDPAAVGVPPGETIRSTTTRPEAGRDESPPEPALTGKTWTALVAVLALAVAGAFLPAWDHFVGYSSTTGRSTSFSLGNAFSGPWQVVAGNVISAVALAAVPIAAVQLRNRAAGAAAVAGSLIVLGAQFTAAVVQVGQPVSPSIIGLTQSQADALGLTLSMKLTAWFTVDALAAFALFAVIMVWAFARLVQENSAGVEPSAPDFRREAMPSSW